MILASDGEHLIVMCEGLELESIARRIEQKHRPLLARFTLKPDIRLDDKGVWCIAQRLGQGVKCWRVNNHTKVWDRHIMPVDRISYIGPCPFVKVGHHLVTEDVPVDPGICTSTARAAKNLTVKASCLIEIMDRNC